MSNALDAPQAWFGQKARAATDVPAWLHMRNEGVRTPVALYESILGKRAPQTAVDIRRLCKQLDVQLEERKIDDDGACRFRTSEPYSAIIEVSKQAAETRKRFTIAHELGHLLLHPETRDGWRRDSFSSSGTNQEEREANGFAADLLVPFADLRAWLNLLRVETRVPVVVAKMAETYEISDAAARIRLDWALRNV